LSPDAILALLKQRTEFTSRYDSDSWRFLGRGAFAVVALVQNRVLDQAVAVKVFHHFDPTTKKRLQAEVTNAGRILSRTVIQIHTAFFLDDDAAWLEMEYVDGIDLQRELERREQQTRPFTTGEALDLALAAAIPVAEAHAVRVIHRDVKPSNYLLPSSRAPLLKLGDFGISKHLQDARLTGTGQFPGTPSWACPEAYDGQPLGTPADVYNLALLTFLLLARRPVYDIPRKATPSQWLAAHRHQAPRRVRDFNPEVHPVLEDALWHGLHKDPARRLDLPALTDAIRTAKQHLVEGGSPALGPPVIKRVPRSVAGLGLASALLALGTLALNHAARRSLPPLPPTSHPASDSPTPPGAAVVPASPPPSTAPAVRMVPKPDFRVVFGPEWLTLTNGTGWRLTNVLVGVVGPEGSTAAAATSSALGPGEELTLPRSVFSPQPNWPPKKVMVSADTPEGRLRFLASSVSRED
jgi:serine/threonine protein kinase